MHHTRMDEEINQNRHMPQQIIDSIKNYNRINHQCWAFFKGTVKFWSEIFWDHLVRLYAEQDIKNTMLYCWLIKVDNKWREITKFLQAFPFSFSMISLTDCSNFISSGSSSSFYSIESEIDSIYPFLIKRSFVFWGFRLSELIIINYDRDKKVAIHKNSYDANQFEYISNVLLLMPDSVCCYKIFSSILH